MTKTTTFAALAAVLLAGSTFTSSAEAGGVRVGFGFPLGSFVAHRFESQKGSSYGSHDRHYEHAAAKRQARKAQIAKLRAERQAAEAAQIQAAKAKKIAAAKAERARQAKIAAAEARQDRIAAQKEKVAVAAVETDTKTSMAPAIYVPETPKVNGTQSTPVAKTAAIENSKPVTVNTEPVIEEIKTETAAEVATVETEEPKTEAKATKGVTVAKAKQVCRRFSALIGNLIDVPCK